MDYYQCIELWHLVRVDGQREINARKLSRGSIHLYRIRYILAWSYRADGPWPITLYNINGNISLDRRHQCIVAFTIRTRLKDNRCVFKTFHPKGRKLRPNGMDFHIIAHQGLQMSLESDTIFFFFLPPTFVHWLFLIVLQRSSFHFLLFIFCSISFYFFFSLVDCG